MSEVLLERPIEGVALLRLNRPEQLNALNAALRKLLAERFAELAADETVRAIVLTGNEKAFAAGADLKEMVKLSSVDHLLRRSHTLWRSISQCPKPIIAAINGYAFGGGMELAMHCDIIVAGESAQLGQPEVRVGLMPGAGGTQRLTRAAGKFKAMKMVLTGRPVSAREASEMGLVSEVVPDAEVLPTALKIAETIAGMPPISIALTKEAVLAGQDASLETGLLLERRAFEVLFATEDSKEGMQAFIEKRKPRYRGR
ncbi:MAG TPA: enoyl-CoA hydratase-related protein [Stellaceae bacterium]|nr:enoyl-CoA hydratase-related protein [Stellaceae bacterium]